MHNSWNSPEHKETFETVLQVFTSTHKDTHPIPLQRQPSFPTKDFK